MLALDDLRFSCTGCGRCCVGGGERQVWLNEAEIGWLQNYLHLARDELAARYLEQRDDGWVIRLQQDGRCGFLDEAGQCGVYAARPVQCRTYPFWPEVLRSALSWQAEAEHCEGIGRGEPVEKVKVQTALRQQRARDAGLN